MTLDLKLLRLDYSLKHLHRCLLYKGTVFGDKVPEYNFVALVTRRTFFSHRVSVLALNV